MVFDSELLEQLRNIQGDKILRANRSVAFSETVQDLLKIGIKNGSYEKIGALQC
jgi:hypothetical protein